MATTTYGIYSGNRRATHQAKTHRRSGGGMPATKLYGTGFNKTPRLGGGRASKPTVRKGAR